MPMKFDPTVNLGHILTFVGFLVTGFAAYGTLDKRISVAEEARATQHIVDRRQDDDVIELKRNNREDIRLITEKLDKILMATLTPQERMPHR